MKKLFYNLTLIAAVAFLSFKLDAVINDQTTDIKEPIRYAIKKSKPDLLKKALTGVELTEKEKNLLSVFANEVTQMRKNNMNLNVMKPKHKSSPYNDYFLLSVITFICGGGITWGLLKEWAARHRNNSIILPIITGTATYLIIKKLMAVGNEKNEEYFSLHPYRSPKQKYLDSIDVLQLAQAK